MTWKITGVRHLPDETWAIEFGDRRYEHRFPHEALRWRAAEYGIDPLDSETLLHVVLHERFIDTRAENPEFLYNTDQRTAREAHLSKIEAVRTDVNVHDPDDHMQAIHTHHASTHDPLDHRRKSDSVAGLRDARSIV